MEVEKGVDAVEGLPVLYVKRLSALVCSDLHLGYEGVMADRGIFLPKVNLKSIKSIIKNAVDVSQAENIIIDGDIKNEFSTVHNEELNEFAELVGFLTGELELKKIIMIKGNHDNFINRIVNSKKIEIHEQEAAMDDVLFFHGEELPRATESTRLMVMGHVHPAITLYDDINVKEKLRCFLHGKTRDGRRLIVLPAISYFAEGVSVNLESVSKVSPVFKSYADINKMDALCVGEGETLSFGSVGNLKKIDMR